MNKRHFLLCICAQLGISQTQLIAKPKKVRKADSEKSISIESSPHYVPKTFDFRAKGVPFSDSQLEQHMKLYKGYVNKRNEIEEKLSTVDKSNVANVTYSPYRSLKIAEVFAHNGSILHELYFGNLGASGEIGPRTQALLTENFGSIDKFKEDLIAGSSCARGWVLTAYCLDDGTIKNFVLDAHHENVPAMVIPILVVDIYEHAYMIDYGINRADYLKTMWDTINWDVIENRINKWIPEKKCSAQ